MRGRGPEAVAPGAGSAAPGHPGGASDRRETAARHDAEQPKGGNESVFTATRNCVRCGYSGRCAVLLLHPCGRLRINCFYYVYSIFMTGIIDPALLLPNGSFGPWEADRWTGIADELKASAGHRGFELTAQVGRIPVRSAPVPGPPGKPRPQERAVSAEIKLMDDRSKRKTI